MLIRMAVILGGVEDRLQKILKAIFEHKWFHGVLVALILLILTVAACGTQPPAGERATGNIEITPTSTQTIWNSAWAGTSGSGLIQASVARHPHIADQIKKDAEVRVDQQNKNELSANVYKPDVTKTTVPTETAQPQPTNTPTFGEMMKDHIVFYLIQPQEGREDACGNITVVPIVSKRLRSNDKLYDVQVALQMLFSLKRKTYIRWYNALWDTDFTIDSYDYIPKKDYMIIQFGGYFPYTKLSSCDKHGIREQIWTTFYHYGFKEKTFKVSDGFLIDRLGGN